MNAGIKRVTVVLPGLFCPAGTAGTMGSTNFDLSWNVMGGGGGPIPSTSCRLDGTVGQIAGIATSANYQPAAGYWIFDKCGSLPIGPLPGYSRIPADPGGDCTCEDLNANNRPDFAKVVLYFTRMTWIAGNGPVAAFD